MQEKAALRGEMRRKRAEFVDSIPENVRSLILSRPPQAVVDFLHEYLTLGFYFADRSEAPSLGWARWFHENGWQIALPRFTAKGAPMEFRLWQNPWDEDELETGPFGIPQPRANAGEAEPSALIVPLLAFTKDCARLGQGGGHYDRWLSEHPSINTIGLAWDGQLVDKLPCEAHDHSLTAVVTPTQIYWQDE